ncbi:M64 family metallopeptidase [Dyadobacter diqingensis]|uniref:M64 family metallopeptidase n=1 Tax=Dyadobacter diqingensis TaxID=2938121 RepID=UPI0020C50B7F|nr:M64 family metallopeptidase [Dyadobacter diqingensis]
MKTSFTAIAGLLLLSIGVAAQKFPVDTIYKAGAIDNRVNIVILGDGFTEEELPKFLNESKKFADFFLSYSPYNRYRNYFNIFSISTPSKESGITNPGTAFDAYPDQPVETKETYFGSSFGNYIHRLVTISRYTTLSNLMAMNFPSYDLIVVLVNSPWYGGSGGSFAVHTLHEQANKIGVHEIGHTLTHLNDEYWAGSGYGWEAPNMTSNNNTATIKWKNWLNTSHIGVFRHGDGDASNWFKPTTTNCLMEVLHKEFCNVCREATVERILELVDPVEKFTPDNEEAVVMKENGASFSVELLAPNPNSLMVEWSLGGKPLDAKTQQVDIPFSALYTRITDLTASVFDSTFTSRQDDRKVRRTKTITWKLERKDIPLNFHVVADRDTVCAGESTILTAQGCLGTLNWSTGEHTEVIKVTPALSADYTVDCYERRTDNVHPAAIRIVVNALPTVSASNTGPYFKGAQIELKAKSSDSYDWIGPDNFKSALQNPVIKNADTVNQGTYTVTTKNKAGCMASASTQVFVDPLPVVDNDLHSSVQVFPNPTKGSIFVKVKPAGSSDFILYDVAGREILRKTFIQTTEISLNKLESGIYVYSLSNGKNETSGKLLLE